MKSRHRLKIEGTYVTATAEGWGLPVLVVLVILAAAVVIAAPTLGWSLLGL
ncbi:hypothetical protein [Caulobacter zeae]|uniref:hypothetical protein n=1 Tax=Caulobacter zeae TaxID=2055137 RepID=UPI0013FDBA47|nr:hypothetical protein [Caulobacter zeae]